MEDELHVTSDDSSVNPGCSNPTEPKVKRLKKFCSRWIREFGDWVKRDNNDDTKVYCSLCDKYFKGGKSEIKKHAKTVKHVDMCQQMGYNPSELNNQHIINVKKGELYIAAFACERNIAISIVERIPK